MLLQGSVYLIYCCFKRFMNNSYLKYLLSKKGLPLPDSEQRELQYKKI